MSAPLYPGKVQDWVFALRAVSGVARSDAEILQLVRRVLDREVPGGGQSDTRLVETSMRPIVLNKTVATRSQQDPIPVLSGGPIVYARVQFPSRSAVSEIPWPSRAVSAGFPWDVTPEQADVMLDSVGEPVGAAGEEPTFLEEVLGEETAQAVEGVTTKVSVAAGIGIALGLVLLLSRRS